MSVTAIWTKPLARRTLPRVRGAAFGEEFEISWVTGKGGPSDPTTSKDAGRTPASQLLLSYRNRLHSCRPRLRGAFPPVARQTRARAYPAVSGSSVPDQEAFSLHRQSVCVSVALPVCQAPAPPLSDRVHPFPQVPQAAPHRAQSRGGDPAHSCVSQSLSPHPRNDAVLHRPAPVRTVPSEGKRRGQSAHDDSR